MATGSQKIIEERQTAYAGMHATMEKIHRGERLTVEEKADFDARNKRITELDVDLRTAQEAEALAERLRQDTATPAPSLINPGEAREAAFSNYLRTGDVTEYRAMGVGTFSAGTVAPNFPAIPSSTPGYLVPPGWWQRLQVALKAFGGIARDFQQLETDSGQSLQWATVDPTSVVGSLLSENATVSTVDYAFGQGQLSAYMYTSGVQLVSFQLANDSAFDIDGFVSDRVGESLGRARAAAVLSGSGAAQPLGITTALAAKTSTGTVAAPVATGGFVTLTAAQVVNLGGSTTTELIGNALSVQTLRSMIASVDPAYRALGAKFYMNDQQLLNVRALSDANGRPLVNLQDGVTPGMPTSIWGYEVVVDNNIPNLVLSTAQGPIFGHLQSAMVLRTVREVGLLRLDQRYADQLQIGYIGYERWDSRSNDLRAAVVVKAAAT